MEQRSLASAACPARSWAWALLGIQEQWELPVWSPEEWKREKVCVRAGDTPPQNLCVPFREQWVTGRTPTSQNSKVVLCGYQYCYGQRNHDKALSILSSKVLGQILGHLEHYKLKETKYPECPDWISGKMRE